MLAMIYPEYKKDTSSKFDKEIKHHIFWHNLKSYNANVLLEKNLLY